MSTMSQFFGGGSTINSTQRGVISLAGSTSSGTATISSVNTSKTQLRFLGFSSTAGSSATGRMFPKIELTNSTTVTATRGAAIADDCSISWELTEWN
jgi:hypothetical protein